MPELKLPGMANASRDGQQLQRLAIQMFRQGVLPNAHVLRTCTPAVHELVIEPRTPLLTTEPEPLMLFIDAFVN